MRTLSLFALVGLIIFAPFVGSAHGTGYLEFNPDYFKTKSLNVSASGTLYEIFIPSNEFLGGADFWFDNAGSSGAATFQLYDDDSNLITSRTITIPHINPVQGGQRVHVDWNSQVSVIGNNKYKIRISSVLPQLQIYYSDRVKVLGHNEPYLSSYLNGAAEVNGEEKEFSFKYALYETTESSAPIISNISWTVLSPTQMRIDFNANEPIDYRIEYGPSGQGYSQSTNFLGEYQFCAEGVALCSLTILVGSDVTYEYVLRVKDSWGNQSQSAGNFTSGQGQTPTPTPTPSSSSTPTPSATPTSTPTPSGSPNPTASPTPDPDAPIITNLRIVETGSNYIKIAWTTNEPANSHLLISTLSLITITDASDPTLELEHLLTTGNVLSPGATYRATVTSIDSGSNDAQASITFTTSNLVPDPPQGTTPTPTPSPNQEVNISGSGTVSWNSSSGGSGESGGGYRIDIFDKNGNFKESIFVPAGSYEAQISQLQEGDSVIVYKNDNGAFEKIDAPVTMAAKNSSDDTFLKRLMGFWWALIPLLAGLGYIFWRNFKQKASQKTAEAVS